MGNKKIGVSISSHSDNDTDERRYDIIEECLQSLIDSVDISNLYINVVSDGITDKHMNILEKYPFEIVYHHKNLGISMAKNTGIEKILNNGCYYGFLLDDDLLFKDKEVFNSYVEAIIKTNIPHYSLYLHDDDQKWPTLYHKIVNINGFDIKKTPMVNGCFLTFTKDLIDKIGYFRILSEYKYGHEHSNFSRRSIESKHNPFFCDVLNSTDMVYINGMSWGSVPSSGTLVNKEGLRINELESIKHLTKYVDKNGIIVN